MGIIWVIIQAPVIVEALGVHDRVWGLGFLLWGSGCRTLALWAVGFGFSGLGAVASLCSGPGVFGLG